MLFCRKHMVLGLIKVLRSHAKGLISLWDSVFQILASKILFPLGVHLFLTPLCLGDLQVNAWGQMFWTHTILFWSWLSLSEPSCWKSRGHDLLNCSLFSFTTNVLSLTDKRRKKKQGRWKYVGLIRDLWRTTVSERIFCFQEVPSLFGSVTPDRILLHLTGSRWQSSSQVLTT